MKNSSDYRNRRKYYVNERMNPEEMSFHQLLERFIRTRTVKNVSHLTIEFYRGCINQFIDFMYEVGVDKPGDVITDDIYEFIELRKRKGNKPPTINKYLRALDAFFRYSVQRGAIDDNPVTPIGRLNEGKRIIRTLEEEHIRAMLSIPNQNTFVGYRNYVFMLFLLDTGVRLQEALEVKLSDVYWERRLVHIIGKNNKEREIPYSEKLREHLERYLRSRGTLHSEYLFVSNEGEQLARRTIQDAISDYANMSNIKGIRISAHTFRHTFAKFYLLQGGDVFTLQDILGHSGIEMVRVYVEMFKKDIVAQHDKYSPLTWII